MCRTLWVAAAGLLIALPAYAQIQNKSLKLNQPAQANQYLVTLDQTGLESASGYTIEAWIYPTTAAGYPTIVGNDYFNGYWLGLDAPTAKLRFWPLGLDQGDVMLSGSPIALNEWSHVAASYDEATHTATLVVNGVVDGSNSAYAGAVSASDAPTCIGGDRPDNGAASYWWRGWLDEVRIWDHAVNTSLLRVLMRHRAGTPRIQNGGGAYNGLVAYWDMEDPVASVYQDRWAGFGEAANDASPINGSALSTTVVPPIPYNHGVVLSGFDEYATRDLPPGFSFEDGLTIEAWIAPDGPQPPSPDGPNSPEGVKLPVRTIMGRSQGQSFWFGIMEDSRLRFYPAGGVGNYFDSPSYVVPFWDWSHVAAVYRPGVAEIYFNGVMVASSTDFTDPVGENDQPPWIGADPPAILPLPSTDTRPSITPEGIPGVPFYAGWLDEVRLTGAALSASLIREGMFRSAPPVELVPDEFGNPHTRLTASFDPRGEELIHASGSARFERSGAPLFGPDADLASAAIHGYRNRFAAATGALPDGAAFGVIESDLVVAGAPTVNDVNIFVSLSATSGVAGLSATALEGVSLTLRNPTFTITTLMDYGDGHGRDLQTVFDDDSPLTWLSAWPPYVDGLQPTGVLTGFNGVAANGTWRLGVSCLKSIQSCVWAWGLSFNDINPLGVDGSGVRPFELALAGANPVRGDGALTFTLPTADDMTLRLIDVSGREVRQLLQGRFAAGEHRVSWSARELSAGVYFLRLERAGGEARQARVTVVR